METKDVINPFSYAQTLDDFSITLKDYGKNSPDLPALDETPLKQLQKFEETLQAGLSKFPEVKKFHDDEANKPPPSQDNIKDATVKLDELSNLTKAAPHLFDASIPKVIEEVKSALQQNNTTSFGSHASGNTIYNLAQGSAVHITNNYATTEGGFFKKMFATVKGVVEVVNFKFFSLISSILTFLNIPHQWLLNFIDVFSKLPFQ